MPGPNAGQSWEKWERLEKIRYSQSTISDCFQDGTTLIQTYEKLRWNWREVYKIPWITVVQHDGNLYSMDNRRLYCFKMAFEDHHTVPVKFYESPEAYGLDRFFSKFSTGRTGHTVQVLGSSSQGDGQLTTEDVMDLVPGVDKICGEQWQSVRSCGVKVKFDWQGGADGGLKCRLSGTPWQIEQARRETRRLLESVCVRTVSLPKPFLKKEIKEMRETWKREHPGVIVSIVGKDTASEAKIVGTEGTDVVQVHTQVHNLVSLLLKDKHEVDLPDHSFLAFQRLFQRSKDCESKDVRWISSCWLQKKGSSVKCKIVGTLVDIENTKAELSTLCSRFKMKELRGMTTKHRSFIIGKKGQTIQSLEADCSALVVVPDQSSEDTTVRVIGFDADDVDKVYARLLGLFETSARSFPLPGGGAKVLEPRVNEPQSSTGVSTAKDHLMVEGPEQAAVTKKVEDFTANFRSEGLAVSRPFLGQLLGSDGRRLERMEAERNVKWEMKDDEGDHFRVFFRGERENVTRLIDELLTEGGDSAFIELKLTSRQNRAVRLLLEVLDRNLLVTYGRHDEPTVVQGPRQQLWDFLEHLKFADQDLTDREMHLKLAWCLLCPGCSASFESRKQLMAHVEKQSGATMKGSKRLCKASACEGGCGAIFGSDAEKEKHARLCEWQKEVRCPVCRKMFRNKLELAEHSRKGPAGCGDVVCFSCNVILGDFGASSAHRESCRQYKDQMLQRYCDNQLTEFVASLCPLCTATASCTSEGDSAAERRTRCSQCSTCRRKVREQQRKWHPDKNLNPTDEPSEREFKQELARKVFQRIQEYW